MNALASFFACELPKIWVLLGILIYSKICHLKDKQWVLEETIDPKRWRPLYCAHPVTQHYQVSTLSTLKHSIEPSSCHQSKPEHTTPQIITHFTPFYHIITVIPISPTVLNKNCIINQSLRTHAQYQSLRTHARMCAHTRARTNRQTKSIATFPPCEKLLHSKFLECIYKSFFIKQSEVHVVQVTWKKTL